MRDTNLRAVDLNLLPPLAALLRERHVSRAAEAVGLSQPAMSRTLRRLRELLGDELLVRGADGFELTLRAARLQEQLADVLPRVEALVAQQPFDPGAAESTFHLGGTDYAVHLLGSELFRRLLHDSPASTVAFHPWHEGSFEEIRRGNLDIVFFAGQPPDDLLSEVVFAEHFACVMDASNPAAATAGDLDHYVALDHLLIDVREGGQPAIEEPLRTLGVPRNGRLVVPYHAAALSLLRGTQLVATVPRSFADAHFEPDWQRIIPAPGEVHDLVYKMVWHPASEDDAACKWVRQLVRECVGSGSPPESTKAAS